MKLKLRDHVKVGPTKPNGDPHPHAGKTGIITEFMGLYIPTPTGIPSAMIKVDPGIEPQGFISVSTTCLEKL